MNTESSGTPIFFLIPVEQQAALMEFQFRHYHRRLKIPDLPIQRIPEIPTEPIELDEIDKFMRKRPHHPKGVGFHG